MPAPARSMRPPPPTAARYETLVGVVVIGITAQSADGFQHQSAAVSVFQGQDDGAAPAAAAAAVPDGSAGTRARWRGWESRCRRCP